MSRIVSWVLINDDRMFHVVNQHWRCKFFDAFLSKITHLGGATFTLSTLFIMLFLVGDYLRQVGIDALFALIIGQAIVQLLKKTWSRPRPYLTLSHVNLCPNPLKDFSFPSGHTATAFSTATVVVIHFPMLATIVLPIALLVGISRMYLGLHYPTDCLIGATIGIVSAVLSITLNNF